VNAEIYVQGVLMKESIAIIGGGIAGLTAGYLLSEKYAITLYEKEGRIGGNAYTHRTESGENIEIAAASVLGPAAMNFLKLCRQAGVPMVRQPRACLISIHDTGSNRGLYLTPLSMRGLLAQRFGLVRSLPSLTKAFYAMYKAV
jgi:uncharacterized protein